MPGPPAKDPSARRRRNAAPVTTKLPATGRQGRVPAWPLSKASAAERAAWNELWRLPQAVVWERVRCSRVVARYVRLLVPVERGGASAFQGSECRQLEDRLGLTPLSMKRLQWEIAFDEVAEARAA